MDRPDGPADKGGEPTDKAAEAADAERAAQAPQQPPAAPGDAAPGAQHAPGEGAAAAAGGSGSTDAGSAGAAGADSGADSGEGADSGADYDAFPAAAEDGGTPSSSAVAQGAGAVVAAGLGFVSLTGSWLGTVAGARESLIGQLQTSQGASVSQQIQEVYGDQWHVTALVSGIFALAALIVAVVVLARPAFGAPGVPQAPWIKSVAWAGVCLGAVGLLLAVLKYSDAILALPSVSS
ncbi:hypothetical protein [Streptomyces sulfonofaciens]|nr:hypothetical protein [Streptomyces sulfonofaciens]